MNQEKEKLRTKILAGVVVAAAIVGILLFVPAVQNCIIALTEKILGRSLRDWHKWKIIITEYSSLLLILDAIIVLCFINAKVCSKKFIQSEELPKTASTKFLDEFKYFRGIAMFTIVLGHFMAFKGNSELANAGFTPVIFIYRCFFAFVNGNTALFVFISGFLFNHVFYNRGFKFSAFMKGKVKNVLYPYLFILTLFTLFQIIMRVYFLKWQLWGNFVQFKNSTFFYWSFWYIPFAMLMFFLSPMYIKFIETSHKNQLISLFVLVLLGIYVCMWNLNPVHGILYYSSVYCFGIFYSINYDKFLIMNKSTKISIWIIFVVLLTVLAISNNYFDKSKLMFASFFPLSLTLILKMYQCIVLLQLCVFIANLKFIFPKKILGLLSEHSFTIFFIHNCFIFVIGDLLTHHFHLFDFLDGQLKFIILIAIALSITVCAICILTARICRLIFGKNSRMLIGS